ncbi:hypothetical protein PG991_005857 [Apiospora marii]|uniref:Reticulon-like protein n=1 Tax=Apiospora marii TaxID=335849 RepID=A0ABR1SAP3_9PEZI
MADTATTNGGNTMDNIKGSKCFKTSATTSDTRSSELSWSPPQYAQAAYDQLSNGPVAQNVKNQHAKTTSELSNLAAARQTPSAPAATGQPLTHYHSFSLRAVVVEQPSFKLTWMALGVTVLAEVAGKAILHQGLATQLRPRKYYTIPRETLDSMIGDVHELINFFVIEAQRVFFAENVFASSAAAIGAFISYYLVKIVPYWGLALIATTLLFFVPLVYTTNQELIDHYLKQASEVVNSQTEQIRQVASKQTAQAAEMTKQYMGDYTAKAQEMIRGRSTSPAATKKPAPAESDFPKAPKAEPEFPAVPKSDFADIKAEEEPLLS